MNKKIIAVLIAFVVVFVCGVAYSQSLEELKAQAREEVRREMGVDRLPSRPAPAPRVGARTTTDMPTRSPQQMARMLAYIVAGVSLLPAGIAKAKGRSFIAWWILSMLCFPVVLLVSIVMKGKPAPERAAVTPGAVAAAAVSSQKSKSVSNRAFIKGFYDEVFDGRNLDAADELVAEGFVGHDLPQGAPFGREGFKKYYRDIFRAFPDLEYRIEDVVADEDKAVVRWVGKGTHGGDFRDMVPTGKPVTIKGISIFRIRDGKITELWNETDVAGLIEQLG